jgi:hypothetical protein
MSHQWLPPPEPEDCLILSRSSRYKGGTLIAEDVVDLATHRRRLADPDGYRPSLCPRCGHDVLHVHDYLLRTVRGEARLAVIRIVRHACASPDCGATWRILPIFLARHLWRTWPTIEREVAEDKPPQPTVAPVVPARTVRRWRERLASAAKQLVVLLATSGGALLEALAQTVGLEATRRTLVDVHAEMTHLQQGRRLAGLAGLIHRLERGIRLM